MALALLPLVPCPPRPASGPNIVVLLSDDQAVGAMGCEGNDWVRTPALDSLAAGGVRFTNAFVTTSLCTPSRASVLLGKYARSHGILDNGPTRHWRERMQRAGEITTFAKVLTSAGYDSAYVGKWHLRKSVRPAGFRHMASYSGQGAYEGTEFEVTGSAQNVVQEGWVDDVATDFAIDFLRRERDGPFLLVLAFKGPHTPQSPPERHRELYADVPYTEPENATAFPPFPLPHEFERLAQSAGAEGPDFVPAEDWRSSWSEARYAEIEKQRRSPDERFRDYHRVITGIDDNVGRVLRTLDDLEVAEDTLVVFLSDNGLSLGQHGSVGKRTAYEESMRIPVLLRPPGPKPADARADRIVLNIDVAPTILDYAGVPIPEGMQGRSVRPLVEGRAGGWREDFLYEYLYSGLDRVTSFVPTTVALRTERYKLIRYAERPAWTELFDLASDPLEQHDLAGSESLADVQAALEARLDELDRALGPLEDEGGR